MNSQAINPLEGAQTSAAAADSSAVPSSAPPGEGAKPPAVVLPAKGPLLTRAGWSAFIAALIVVCAVAPVLNLWVSEGSALHMSTYAVALLGKIMC